MGWQLSQDDIDHCKSQPPALCWCGRRPVSVVTARGSGMGGVVGASCAWCAFENTDLRDAVSSYVDGEWRGVSWPPLAAELFLSLQDERAVDELGLSARPGLYPEMSHWLRDPFSAVNAGVAVMLYAAAGADVVVSALSGCGAVYNDGAWRPTALAPWLPRLIADTAALGGR